MKRCPCLPRFTTLAVSDYLQTLFARHTVQAHEISQCLWALEPMWLLGELAHVWNKVTTRNYGWLYGWFRAKLCNWCPEISHMKHNVFDNNLKLCIIFFFHHTYRWTFLQIDVYWQRDKLILCPMIWIRYKCSTDIVCHGWFSILKP